MSEDTFSDIAANIKIKTSTAVILVLDASHIKRRLLGIFGQQRLRSASTKADPGRFLSAAESLTIVRSINRMQMPGWDSAHAQDDMTLACSLRLAYAWSHVCRTGIAYHS